MVYFLCAIFLSSLFGLRWQWVSKLVDKIESLSVGFFSRSFIYVRVGNMLRGLFTFVALWMQEYIYI